MMHNRWAGLATWEECLAVERDGGSRDTIEPWERARWTVKSVWATDEPPWARANQWIKASHP